MRFFTEAHEIFNGGQSTGETEDHIDGDQAAELKPGECRAVDAKPERLTHDHVCFGGFFPGKAAMEKIDDGQDGASKRHQRKNKESPARPNGGKRLCDEKI